MNNSPHNFITIIKVELSVQEHLSHEVGSQVSGADLINFEICYSRPKTKYFFMGHEGYLRGETPL